MQLNNLDSGNFKNSYFGSDDYQKQTKEKKMQDLWSMIAKDNSPSSYWNPVSLLAGIMSEDISRTLKYKGDAMEPSYFLGYEKGSRNKYIHTVGATAPVKFVSNKQHPYTGIF